MGWHKIKSPHKLFIYKDLINLQVIPSGFEPETLCLEGRCSIQLSYETINLQKFWRRKYKIFNEFRLN